MAKIKRFKLSWQAPDSSLVIGYRLYWSSDNTINYESNFIELGNLTEVYLPEVLELDPRYGKCVMLGIVAVESHGNESDMVIISAPHQIKAPPAPTNLLLTALNEFSIVESNEEAPDKSKTLSAKENHQEELKIPGKEQSPLLGFAPIKRRVKYYDDVGYRKPLKIKQSIAAIRGWVDQRSAVGKDNWMRDFSDHSLLYFEVQKV